MMEREQRRTIRTARQKAENWEGVTAVSIDQLAIKRNYGVFAVQQLSRIPELSMSWEYKIDGGWTNDPPTKKPDDKRLVFGNMDSFEAARAVCDVWGIFDREKVDSPVYPEEVFRRIAGPAITGRIYKWFYLIGSGETILWGKDYPYGYETTLFTPWGVRPEGSFGKLEESVLERISFYKNTLSRNLIVPKVVIMPADVYATDINSQVTPEQAEKYFEDVEKAAKIWGFEVESWSQIRSKNRVQYEHRAAELTQDEITLLLGESYVREAIKTASRRSGYQGERDVVNSAFAYLRERICEAEIVEKVYRPIKLSAVTKGKDNGVDQNLPRVYVIPSEMRFPWLK